MKLLFQHYLILLLLSTQYIHAQTYQNVMKGTFTLNGPALPPTPVTFILSWNETGSTILGTYEDNTLTSSTIANGSTLLDGRNFQIELPVASHGIKSINILAMGSGKKNIPIALTLKNSGDGIIRHMNLNAELQDQSTNKNCIDGFGELEEFCGIYSGVIREITDVNNRCLGIDASGTKLVLDPSLNLKLYMGVTNTLVGMPMHYLGVLPPLPETHSINVTQRNCENLTGTEFPPESCRALRIIGSFGTLGFKKTFAGTYTITDEITDEYCEFTLDFSRE